jgi:oxalate decarboxylase/phosphoglucose isomerase-like protein (cupin superfamily)
MSVTSRVVQPPADPASDDQPRKLGIWFGERIQAAAWRLGPGQRIVAHCHPRADSVIVVLSGRGQYFVYDDAGPDPAVRYVSKPDEVVAPPPPADPGPAETRAVCSGSVALTSAGRFYGLVNDGADQLVAVVVTGPDASESVYTVRMP